MMMWTAPIMLMASVATPAITDADRAAIASRVTAFDAVMKEGRISGVMDFLPPRLLRFIGEKAGLSEADVRTMMAKQMAAAVKDIRFESFGMDVAAATVATTPDGKRAYMLIPTYSVIAIPDAGRIKSNTSTLALQDDGQWYLVRIDNAQQIGLLQASYPEFAGVTFPAGTTETLK